MIFGKVLLKIISIWKVHKCHSFNILMALNESEPLSTTQISEEIAINSKGQLFKVSGALKDSLENRLRKDGYVDGTDIPNEKTDRKPIRMTLYSITPKGQKLLKRWLAFLSAL
jgi:DNA-binding PadR family transcriptional regulator